MGGIIPALEMGKRSLLILKELKMKKISLLVGLALIGLSQTTLAATQDLTSTSCKVLKVTAYSKSSALETAHVTAILSCSGAAPMEVHSVAPGASQILIAARNSGALIEVTYRKFGSSFDGTNGQILSITE
jgi:hypothetical protein